MKRIGILTAGGDTPALNATIYGAVLRASQRRVEVYGFIKGFSSLFNPRAPHVRLNPLLAPIPELDMTRGGTIIGASRDYVDAGDKATLTEVVDRLRRLEIEGLICIGGDGTLSGMQALSDYLPTVLAPKTIDNDLGLNYRHEPDEWVREPQPEAPGYRYIRGPARGQFDLGQMVNYVTPGFATAVFVSSWGVGRIRTTAESHRRIAIIEVMGRHSGYLALGAAYGQPDIVLIPEVPLNVDRLVARVIDTYDMQKNVVIVCGEGVVDEQGRELGAETASTDPAGNKVLTGAADALRHLLIDATSGGQLLHQQAAQRIVQVGGHLHLGKVGHTVAAAASPFTSTASTAPSSAATPPTCYWKGTPTASPFCNGTGSAASTSTASTATIFAIAMATFTPARLIPVLRSRASGLVAHRHRLPVADLQPRRRPGRPGSGPPADVPPRQSHAAVPFRQRRSEQAHLLPGLTTSSRFASSRASQGSHSLSGLPRATG